MDNREIRQLAFDRLVRGRWFWKLLGAGILLQICARTAFSVLEEIFGSCGVCSWFSYWEIIAENQETLTTPVPELTHDFIWRATTASALEVFVGLIMMSIIAYGSAVLQLKCLKHDESRWLKSAFGGFKMPLTLAGILLFRALIGIAYLVLAIIPAYRYRFLFLVKAENPDLSIRETFRKCRDLMEGHKWESFLLDCSYWKPITLVLVALMAVACGVALAIAFKDIVAIAALAGLVALFLFFVALAGAIVLGQYISVGQGFLYEELKQQNERSA